MKDKEVAVSVIIPAYNCSAFLENIVDSIRKSGLDAEEILIINDGSEDDTEAVARQLQRRYPYVREVSQDNRGVSSARNRGIQEAVGDYLFFVDADDSLVPGSLADAKRILSDMHPDMLIFGLSFDYYHCDALYRSENLVYPEHGLLHAKEWAEVYRELYLYNALSPVWNKIIRRDLILDHQLTFREDMIEMEDYIFSAQCLLYCERIYLLDKVVYRYRQAEDEKGTFNRLWRIQSLSEYMLPFYETSDALEARFLKNGIDCHAKEVSDLIYAMLFHEQLRFANLSQIRTAAEDMLDGPHSHIISKIDPKLYHDLKERRIVRVWCRRVYRRVRHQATVRIKYLRRMRMNK